MNNSLMRIQAGFSMIELVVATAIFSMGLGSLSLMFLASVYGTAEAHHKSVATTQASSLAETIALQSDAFGHSVNPTGAGVSAGDIEAWQDHLNRALPGVRGVVCRDGTPEDGDETDPSCDGDGGVVVKIFWSEPRHEQAPDGGRRRVVNRLPW